MANPPNAKIRASRKILENPYAHLDDEGGYDAIFCQSALGVHESRRLSGNPYAYLDEGGGFAEYHHSEHTKELVPQELRSDSLLGGKKKGESFSKREIEEIVRKLQIEMWKNRANLWPEKPNIAPIEILDPSIALRLVGYRLDICSSLGQYSNGRELFEVAGIVDEFEQTVQISNRFSSEIQNFTTAHELGHVILHQATGLHRDRAQDGGAGSAPRDETEVEADIFAAFFLMPKKQIEATFKRLFLMDHFVISNETAFALGFDGVTSFEKKCRTLRDLANLLASAEKYNRCFFKSMAQQFGVSTEAMAIRLEELSLVSR